MAGPAILIPLGDNKSEIKEIASKTGKILEDHNGIKVKDPDAVWTVVYKVFDETIKWIADNRKESNIILNFYDVFDIGVTYRESDDSEKDGNFTPYLKLRESVIEKIKNNENLTVKRNTSEELTASIYVEAMENSFELDQINRNIVEVLKENHHIECCELGVAPTIAVVFVREVFNWLNKNSDAGDDIVIDFCRLIEFGLTYVDDNLIPFMSEGQRFKLLIKSDDKTEKGD